MAKNESMNHNGCNQGKRKHMEKNKGSCFPLGSLTFEETYEGRFKCVETGHEMLSKDIECYKQSKRYKLALIDVAVSQKQKKFPFSIFERHPNNKMKLICKITGDIVNKSEEHILQHVNGSKFLLSSGKEIDGESMNMQQPEEGTPCKKGSYKFKKIRVRERRKNLRKKREKVYGSKFP